MANEFLTYDLLRQQKMARLNRFALPQPSNAGPLPAPVGNELSLALAGPQLKTQEDYLNYLKNAGKVNTNDAGYKAALKQAQKSGETVKYLGADGQTYAVNPEGKAHFVSHSDVTQYVSPKEKPSIVRNTSDVTTPVETTPAGTDKKVVDKKARKARLSKNRKKYQEAKKSTPAPATTTPVETPQVAGEKLRKESGFQRMEREAAENRGKGSGLKFQEGSGKGPQPGDYAGVHVDQKAHNKKQAEYDKMFADLDKADKEARKAAVEANKGKKSGVVGAEAKAQKQRIADLEKEIADLKKNSGKEGTNLKEFKQRFRKFKKADNINKLKKFGKWAGIATVVGIIGAGIWALCKNKKDDAVAEETPVVTTPPATEEDTTTVVTTPPVTEETPVVTTPPTEETPEEETTPANLKYTVKKGDNIWNIAKAQLEDELGRTPTRQEIYNKTIEIIELNPGKLKYKDENGNWKTIEEGQDIKELWKKDDFIVDIKVGQELDIAA